MTAAELIARLQAQTTSFKTIEGGNDFAAVARENPPRHRLPALFVFLTAERAGGNEVITGLAVRQELTLQFALVIATSHAADPRGAKAKAEVEALRLEARDAVLGYAPPSVTGVVEYRGGRILGIRDGVTWWQSDVSVTDHIRHQ